MTRSSTFNVGPLAVTVQRTVRVSDDRAPSQLPPGLGGMTLYPVKEFRDKCPSHWEDEAVFAVIHPQEALWLSFRAAEPVAIIAGCGGVNAITGKPLNLKPEAGNYMVAPGQPWLDGWKDEDGTVYQFVGTFYEQGKGNTVAEQILGEDSKSGAIGIATFKHKKREGFKNPVPAMQGGWMPEKSSDPYMEMMASAPLKGAEPQLCSTKGMTRSLGEMGVGKGGKIIQKVYEDPNGVDAWETEPAGVSAIYLVDATAFTEITGEPAPATPVGSDAYVGPWFGLQDKEVKDQPGSSVFTGLKNVFHQGEEKAEADPPVKKDDKLEPIKEATS